MICATDILDTAINTDCATPYGMEHNGYLTLRSGLRFKSETDLTVTFVPSEAIIPVYHPAFDIAYKPKSEGEVNEYGLFKFNKSIELFLISNVPLTQKQVLQLKNEDWCFVGKQKDGQIIVIGYERGLALNKTSQEFLSTTTHGGILLTFEEKYVNTGMLFGTDALYAYKDFEVLTGFSIINDGVMSVAVDSDKVCKIICPDGTILTSTAGVINTVWGGDEGEVIILVQKGTNLLDFDASNFTGTLNFVVSDKTIISFTACQLTTSMCDAILDVLIANGTVTGTHMINFTDNIAAPTGSKVTTVEGLGWTVPF